MEEVNHLMKHSSFQGEGHSLMILKTTEAHQETSKLQIKGSVGPAHTLTLSATPLEPLL